MKWQDKLTKAQLNHLKEHGVTSVREFKKMRESQKEWDAERRKSGLGSCCHDCVMIDMKLNA